jgi:hypothetical protein
VAKGPCSQSHRQGPFPAGLSIAKAQNGLAPTFGVKPEAIEITIRGRYRIHLLAGMPARPGGAAPTDVEQVSIGATGSTKAGRLRRPDLGLGQEPASRGPVSPLASLRHPAELRQLLQGASGASSHSFQKP